MGLFENLHILCWKPYVLLCLAGWTTLKQITNGNLQLVVVHVEYIYKNLFLPGIGVTEYSVRAYVTAYKHECWKCGTDLKPLDEQYFCECGMIQPPNEERHFFDVMRLPMTYDIDEEALTTNFRDLQRQLHPDKFSQKSQVL